MSPRALGPRRLSSRDRRGAPRWLSQARAHAGGTSAVAAHASAHGRRLEAWRQSRMAHPELPPTPTEQLAARDHIGSHARLLAGLGTGKTWVLTQRVTSLVRDHGIDPQQILALTFTRYAAGELRRRVTAELGEAQTPQIRTIHSFALQQLLANRVDLHGGGRVRVADDWEERRIVVEDLKRMLNLPDEAPWVRWRLHRLEEDGVMAEHSSSSPFQRRYPAELRERAVRMVLETASERGERFGAVTRVAQRLGIGPESLRKWSTRPRSTAASGRG